MATEGKRRVVPDMIAFTAAMFIEGARNAPSWQHISPLETSWRLVSMTSPKRKTFFSMQDSRSCNERDEYPHFSRRFHLGNLSLRVVSFVETARRRSHGHFLDTLANQRTNRTRQVFEIA